MTTDRERILSQFIDAWNTGRRPDADDFVARVPEAERAELADEIASFLTWAPTPAYDDAALDAIEAEPVVAEALAAARGPGGLWPALLPRLRARASVSVAELASGVVGLLGLPAGTVHKTADYLAQMEHGDLPQYGVSRRLLDALARLLGVESSELEAGGGLASWHPVPAAAPQFRADPAAADAMREDLEVLADAIAFDGPAEAEWDEVDELFRGGR